MGVNVGGTTQLVIAAFTPTAIGSINSVDSRAMRHLAADAASSWRGFERYARVRQADARHRD